MSEQTLREELLDAFKNRAILYYLIYDEIRKECGAEQAEAVLSRAIYRRGAEKGQQAFAHYGPRDLQGLKQAFLSSYADGGSLFQPEVVRDEPQGLNIRHRRCPLKEAWEQYGLSDEDLATMCRIASQVDNGTFEAAGFRIEVDSWQPGQEGCCRLCISPGE